MLFNLISWYTLYLWQKEKKKAYEMEIIIIYLHNLDSYLIFQQFIYKDQNVSL